MKKLIALLLALCLVTPLAACAAEGPSVSVRSAWDHGLELVLSGLLDGKLIVAAFRGNMMTAVAAADVTPGTETVSPTFPQTIQEDDIVKAFLIDPESSAPLMPAAELELPAFTGPAPDPDPAPTPDPEPTPDPTPTPDPEPESGKVLVAYFSCTNNTKSIAEKIAAHLDAALHEIAPADPYTAADLNYNSDCRANREQNDPAARPAIRGNVDNWDSYDVVFLGYPIWWGAPPKIMLTFMESHNFRGKTVIPFCTSGSSSYNDAAMKALAVANVNWVTGRRFPAGANQATVSEWVDSLGLDFNKEEEPVVNKLNVTFNGHTYTATLAENPSVTAFVEYLKSQGGSIVVRAHDYGSFEKVGDLGATIVQTNTQINTSAGDLILYQGNSVCLYYSTNSWNFTRLGKLDGDLSNLKSDLGSGNVDITYSLAK